MKIVLSQNEVHALKKLKALFEVHLEKNDLHDYDTSEDITRYKGVSVRKDFQGVTLTVDSDMTLDFLRVYEKMIPPFVKAIAAVINLFHVTGLEESCFNERWRGKE